jgi:hypothetical protein
MSEKKFITVDTAISGKVVIAIDNIASVKSWMGSGSLIVLKEVKNGSNIEIISSWSLGNVINAMNNA